MSPGPDYGWVLLVSERSCGRSQVRWDYRRGLEPAIAAVPSPADTNWFKRLTTLSLSAVPKPVGGSHPGAALKPGMLKNELFPVVTSWKDKAE